MLEGRHYQNAYVTRDIGKAVARCRRAALTCGAWPRSRPRPRC